MCLICNSAYRLRQSLRLDTLDLLVLRLTSNLTILLLLLSTLFSELLQRLTIILILCISPPLTLLDELIDNAAFLLAAKLQLATDATLLI